METISVFRVSFCTFAASKSKGVEEKIINTAADLFLTLGVKSVTMDEIAQKLGMSKKTIYTYYPTKTKLIEATTAHVFRIISEGIEEIKKERKDPIEELFTIKNFVLLNLKDEKSSPQYQLEKYYPKIYSRLRLRQKELMESFIIQNLERGKKEGVYREDLPVQFTGRIYFSGMMGIKDRSIFPEEMFASDELFELYLEYHLRSIVTEKGLSTLNRFTEKNKQE